MSELWNLVWGKPAIDPDQLAAALAAAARGDALDYRDRLLIRDGAQALEDYWGREKLSDWVRQNQLLAHLEPIRTQTPGPVGYPFIKDRLMPRTAPDTIRQLLRELSTRLHHPAAVVLGGSAALILHGTLTRATKDIDIVDEVPPEIRADHAFLAQLGQRYSLAVTHFQSPYLPTGWDGRVHTLGAFGRLSVALVDVPDIFLRKLFSPRSKDLDDLRLLLPTLDRDSLVRRLRDTCGSFLADASLRAHAERNWYILTGDPLPEANP